jgi:UDP-2-acetamido-3-amino-2,3-dideoxy-glucuronate N-acetyltransferase
LSEVVRHIGRNVKIGKDVKIWHFTYIGDNTEIGEGTKIGSLTHIDYGVKIGRNCKIEGMAYIPPLTVIEDEVFVGPGVIFTNDPFPMSPKMVGVHVESGAVICAGSILKAGIRIGSKSVIGMGSIVTKDVPSETIVYGNPARSGYPLSEFQRRKKNWEKNE